MTTQKKNKKCLHVVASKITLADGEALVCSSCDTVMRFTRKNGTFIMFPTGGTMTTAAKVTFSQVMK